MALTDSMQNVVESYTYSSFGEIKRQGDKVKNTYTFTGREWDEETGLYYYRARYYSPEIGRFTSFDPILHPANGLSQCCGCKQFQNVSIPSFESLLENPQTLNPYVYVGNSPINLTDPTGLSSKCCIGGIEGEWKMVDWKRIANAICRCYWLCVPPGGTWWSSDPIGLPSTLGVVINDPLRGGGEKGGNWCLCKEPS